MMPPAWETDGGRLPARRRRGWQREAEDSTVTCASCRSRVLRWAGDRKGGVFFCFECVDRSHPELPEFYDELGEGD